MFQTPTALFKTAVLKNYNAFCRDQPSSFFHWCLNSKFSNRFFISHHILSSFPMHFYCWSYKFNHNFRQQNICGGTINSFCVGLLIWQSVYMLTQSLWSEGPIAWICNFHQMHLVIKDANSFQSVLGVPDLNLVLNLTWHHVTWLKCL